jgi:AraC-like DNA-binding protein
MNTATGRVNFFQSPDVKGLEILTCSDTTYCFPPHFHNAYCIWLTLSGAEVYTQKGNSDVLKPGDLGIIAPGEVHSNLTFESDTRQLITFYMEQEYLAKLSEDIQGNTRKVQFRTRYQKDPKAISLLLGLKSSLDIPEQSMGRMEKLFDAFAYLISSYGENNFDELISGYEAKRVKKIIDIFHSCICDDIKLDYLAGQLHCTQHYLIRFFKKHVGLSPHAYLIQLRLEKAKRLLQNNIPISHVAQETGFADQSHLTRHFRNKFGIPPGAYQLNYK